MGVKYNKTDRFRGMESRLIVNVPNVCFINPDSLNVTPYFSQYLECYKGDYELIYWNRSVTPQEAKRGEHIFHSPLTAKNSLMKLIQLARGYFGFKRFAGRIIKQGNYDRVVALTGNTGAILNKTLTKYYAGNYLVDVRDYFLENISLYAKMEQRALDNAAFVVASSPAYTAFLGDCPLQIMHNDTAGFLGKELSAQKAESKADHPFVLASIGTAKNIEYDKKVIRYFANDQRFELRFIGRGYDQLQEFVQEVGATNVVIGGEFDASRTAAMYADVDAILNMYGNHHPHYDYALPNKLYIAARAALPIVVCEDTYLAEVVEKNNLGMALDLDDASGKERILEINDPAQAAAREQGAKSFIAEVEEQNSRTKALIRDFLNDESSGMERKGAE